MAKQPKQSLYEAFSKQLKPQVSTTLSNLKPVVNDRPTTSKPLQNLSNAPVRTQEDIGKKTQAKSPQRTFNNQPMENRSTVQDERPIPKVLQKGKSPQPINDAIRIQDERPIPTAKPSLDGQLQINQNRQFTKPVTTPQQSQSQQCFKQDQQVQQRQQQAQQQQYQQYAQSQQSQRQQQQQPIQSRQPQQQLPQQQTKLSVQNNQNIRQQQEVQQQQIVQQVQQRPQTQQSQTQLRQPPPQIQQQQPQPKQVQQKQQPPPQQQQTFQQPQQQRKQEPPRQYQEQSQPMNAQPKMMAEDTQDTRLFECPEGCGRSFNAKALEKHSKICKKVFQEKRKVFDSQGQRALEEEEAQYKAPPPPPSKKQQQKKPQQQQQQESKPKWKAQSEAFRAIIKQGKGQQLTAQEQAQLKNAMEASQDLVQCKFCNRKFNAETAKKHIAFCETKAKQAVSQKKKK